MSKPTAAEMLAKCAREVGLSPDQQVVALAGFLCQARPSIDPEKFADAMASLMAEGGLPLEEGVTLLCGLVDREDRPGDFFNFLNQFAQAFARPQFQVAPPAPAPAPPPEAPPVRVPVLVNSVIYQRVETLLAEKQPVAGMDLGHVIHRFTAKLTGLSVAMTDVCVDLVNADAGPQLDPYIMHQSACAASGPPSRDLAKPMTISYAGVRFEVQLTPSDVGQL